MPTYAYRCTACAHEFDIFQSFSESPLKECPECGSQVRRVFQPVGIVFKGSGWYVNDSRKTPDKDAGSKPKSSDDNGDASPKSEKTEKTEKADAKPAASGAKETAASAPSKVAAD